MSTTQKSSDDKRPTGKGEKYPAAQESTTNCECCEIDIHIESRGDVNIYNCSTPGETTTTSPPPTPQPCFPPEGSCFPAVPGAKHKQGRARMLANLAARARVPSTLAASTVHLARRFVLGKAPANALETKAFATLEKIGRDTLSCMVSAFDAVPPPQRNKLFAPSLNLEADQPLEETAFTTALTEELRQRIGVEVFNDPDLEERPSQMRIFQPSPEDFFSQVRICKINGLRTANFIPTPSIGEYLPEEIQQDCTVNIVNGQPEVICQVRTTDCPGNSLGPVCARVIDVSQGDGILLEGVNYFSVDAKVRITNKQTGAIAAEVDAFVRGDVDTPRTEEKDGQTVLINDCRVHDQLSFQVPKDLLPGLYQIQVAIPNTTGMPQFGDALLSNLEFINVLPPPTARFQIVAERIIARRETSPQSFGSDEVGLQTLAFPLFATGELGTDEPLGLNRSSKEVTLIRVTSESSTDCSSNTTSPSWVWGWPCSATKSIARTPTTSRSRTDLRSLPTCSRSNLPTLRRQSSS